jgi:hypothetical protein
MGFPQEKIDNIFKTIETMPPELVQAYYDMQKEGILLRLDNDPDYQKSKDNFPGLKDLSKK